MDTFFDYGTFKNLFHDLWEGNVTAIAFCLLLAIIFLVKRLWNGHKNNKWRKKQLDGILKDYGDYTKWKERRLYIDTGLQTTPPNDYEEPSEAQSQDIRELGQKKKWYLKNSSIDFFIDNVFRENNSNPPYYCILGGSGIGKSTFVVHLVRSYINKYNKESLPYPIKLVNCGEKTEDKDNFIINRINSIDDKNNTILIIDALDESHAAISSFNEFFSSLRELICQFRIVVLTCRTQFFEKYEDEPSLLPIRDPKTKKSKQFKKYYVSPLYDYEIQHYLNKKYLLKFMAKKKAKLIVEKCKKLMARPLLLSYIDDLVNSDTKNYSISKIYEIIIDKWLEREANFAAFNNINQYKKDLFDFSSEIALCIAQTNENNDSINDIISKYSSIITKKNLTGRSLLNRNSQNDYKFAHKSFMEYLVAKQLFENNNIPLDSIDCTSNDMIPEFWADMINTSYFDYQINSISINNTISYQSSIKTSQNQNPFPYGYGFPYYTESHKHFILCQLNLCSFPNTLSAKKFLAQLYEHFIFDCVCLDWNNDNSFVFNLLKDSGAREIIILNYNFKDIEISNYIKLIDHLSRISFIIRNKSIFEKSASDFHKMITSFQGKVKIDICIKPNPYDFTSQPNERFQIINEGLIQYKNN
ncbi:MAG: hypothetical protein J6T22_00440 [Bacteroidales bacterium]|nr:hypothetical protein [Bacteroidales bacterium]